MYKLKDAPMGAEARGQIRVIWPQLTDDDLDEARDDPEKLVGRIKEKTGGLDVCVRARLGFILKKAAEEGREGNPRSRTASAR